MRRWRPRLRQDTCISTGELVSPVTAGLHALPAGRGAASARPILNHVQRRFLMVFRPRPSASSSTLKRVHFSSLGISRPESINFFTHRMVLKSDQGTEFINHEVKNLCVEYGCAQEFSCPGDSGKWQNGVVERRIKELGTTARKLMHTSQMLPEAKMHALYHPGPSRPSDV